MKHLLFLHYGCITTVEYFNPSVESKPKARDTVIYSCSPEILEDMLGLDNISVAIKGSAHANPTYQSGNIWYKPLESQFGYGLNEFQKGYALEAECTSLGYDGTSAGVVAREALEIAIKATYGKMPRGLQKEAHNHFSSLYQGPMILCRTGFVEQATYLDQDGAYLAAMLEPLPDFNRYPMRADSPPEPEEILSGYWSVDGTFDTGNGDYLPSLQRRSKDGNVWLNGRCHTKVAGRHLQYLLEQNKLVSAPSFKEAWCYDMDMQPSKVMLHVHKQMMRMSKALRKKVYTRLIGGMAHHTMYRYDASVGDLNRMAENGLLTEEGMKLADSLVMLPGSGLPFKVIDVREYDFIPATYRPDIAWLIWERCTAETLRICQKFGSNLLASHIDSCVVSGDHSAPNGWSVKAKGEYVGYGVGNYICGDHISASGHDSTKMTIQEHLNRVARDHNRSWPISIVGDCSDKPVQYTDSISRPFYGTDSDCGKFWIDDELSTPNDVPTESKPKQNDELLYGIFKFVKGPHSKQCIDVSTGQVYQTESQGFIPGLFHVCYRLAKKEKEIGGDTAKWSNIDIVTAISAGQAVVKIPVLAGQAKV